MDKRNTPDLNVIHARNGSRTGHLDLRAHLRKQLKLLSESQEALADAREALLLERSAFRSRGKRVQAQRVRTGNAEIVFMNVLREFCNEHRLLLPPILTATYDTVQQERDKLGSLETDYFLSEESLGSREWEFLEEENDFYQYELEEVLSKDIPEDFGDSIKTEHQPFQSPEGATVPSVLLEYQEAVAKHNQLMHKFNALRPEQAERLDWSGQHSSDKAYNQSHGSEDSDFTTGYMDLLAQIMECEVKVQQLKQDLMQRTIPAPIILFPKLDESDSREIILQQPLQRRPQSLLDGAPPDSTRGLPIRDRIPEWLLSYLKGGAIEKLLFINILREELKKFEINQFHYDSWERLATRFWRSDMAEKDSRLPTPRGSQPSRSDANSVSEASHSQRSSVQPVKNDDVNLGDDILSGVIKWIPNTAEEPTNTNVTPQGEQLPPPEVYIRNAQADIDVLLFPRGGPASSLVNEDQSDTHPSILVKSSTSDISATHELEDSPKLTSLCPGLLEKHSDSNPVLDVVGTDSLEEDWPPKDPQSRLLDAPSSIRYDSCQDSDIEEAQRRRPSITDDIAVCSAQREDDDGHNCIIDQSLITYCPSHNVHLELPFNPSEPITRSECPLKELDTAASTPTASQTPTGNRMDFTRCTELHAAWESPPLKEPHGSSNLQVQPPSRAHSVSERSSRPRKSDPGKLHIPFHAQHRRSNSASSVFARIGICQSSFVYSMEHTLQAR